MSDQEPLAECASQHSNAYIGNVESYLSILEHQFVSKGVNVCCKSENVLRSCDKLQISVSGETLIPVSQLARQYIDKLDKERGNICSHWDQVFIPSFLLYSYDNDQVLLLEKFISNFRNNIILEGTTLIILLEVYSNFPIVCNCIFSDNCILQNPTLLMNSSFSNTVVLDNVSVSNCSSIKGQADSEEFPLSDYFEIEVGAQNKGRKLIVKTNDNYKEIVYDVFMKSRRDRKYNDFKSYKIDNCLAK